MLTALIFSIVARQGSIPGVELVKPTFDVSITVNDLKRSAAFYGEGLGLKEVGSGRIGQGVVFRDFAYGPSVIRLIRFPEPSARVTTGLREAFGYRAITLVAKDIQPLLDRLKEKKIKSHAESAGLTGDRREQLNDTEGNVIEIVQPGSSLGGPETKDHIQIVAVVADSIGSANYYRTKLGFTQNVDKPTVPGASGLDVLWGNTGLRLLTFSGNRIKNPPKPEAVAGIRTLIFTVKDADEAWKHFRDTSSGIQGDVETIEGYGKRFYLSDADGNWIEFVQRIP